MLMRKLLIRVFCVVIVMCGIITICLGVQHSSFNVGLLSFILAMLIWNFDIGE